MNKLSNTILASGLSALIFVPQILAQTSNFVDVRGYWGEQYVTALTERSIISGFPDGLFKPNAEITRAQFAAIAVKAFDLPLSSNTDNFKDVSSNYWASSAIRAVSRAGLVTGFPDGTFRPEERITRTQVLVILSKALGNKATTNNSEFSRYSDYQTVPDWATESVSKAANARIIVNFPDPSRIDPNDLATRGEVAAFMYQTLFKLGDRNLSPLGIGTLNSTTNPPVVSNLVIEKIETNTTSSQVLTLGNELLVNAYGTPGANASFELASLNRNISVNMTEVKSGVYEGKYTIQQNDGDIDYKLIVKLRKQNTNPVTKEFNRAIAINSITTNNPQTLKPEITNFSHNDRINLPANLVGQTLPNADVRVTIEALNSIFGIMEISETLFSNTVRANKEGKFIVNFPSVDVVSGTRYRVRLTATHNNRSQSNELFLRQN
jgi:hypothetical protein